MTKLKKVFKFLRFKNKSSATDDAMTLDNMNFNAVEAFNALSVNVNYLIPVKGAKTVCLSSAVAGEGKTTVSVNTAISLANSGKKVVLVDMDLRRPRVHRFFGINKKDGVSDVLCHIKGTAEVIKRTKYENLDLIVAGNQTPNPLKLLASSGIVEMLDYLKANYDWVIIDTPPVNVVSDMLLVLPHTDGVLIVVDQSQANHAVLSHAIEAIKVVNGVVLGVVLNKVSDKMYSNKSHYSKYKYRYKYKYGYSAKAVDLTEETEVLLEENKKDE